MSPFYLASAGLGIAASAVGFWLFVRRRSRLAWLPASPALLVAPPFLKERQVERIRLHSDTGVPEPTSIHLTGLTKTEAEEVLDWLEANGYRLLEPPALTDAGFSVSYRK